METERSAVSGDSAVLQRSFQRGDSNKDRGERSRWRRINEEFECTRRELFKRRRGRNVEEINLERRKEKCP